MEYSATSQKSDYLGGVVDYIALLKPRVMSLVVFTAFIGLHMAPGYIHPVMALLATICIAIGSGAAGALNMWYDRDIDAIMSRTQNRPIPGGRVEAVEALHLSIVLSVFSVCIMGLFINILSAFLLAFAIIFYGVVYTMWLKRSTVQNIVIGGISGALPPIIGWAAVTNSVSIESIVMFLIIFLWTPPHFWALSLKSDADYRLANVPMLSVVEGPATTLKHILIYTILLVGASLLPFFLGMTTVYYLISASLLGLGFVYCAIKMFTDKSYYLKTFKYSILYLFLLFLVLAGSKL